MRTIVIACFVVAFVLPLFAQDPAARLEKSPRHQEWAVVKNGERQVHCFVVYPQSKEKTPAIVVIHENKGLTDWVRTVADQLAENGVIAIAPDLLSGYGPNGGRTSEFLNTDAATEALYKLQPEQVLSDLDAVSDYVTHLPAANGKLAVGGFCWGGGQTLRFATHRKDLAAAFVFYGAYQHTPDEIARISCPVYGFYGGADSRIDATLPGTIEMMKNAGKKFEPVTYEGADHAFMRKGEEAQPSEANRNAYGKAWDRWKKLLSALR